MPRLIMSRTVAVWCLRSFTARDGRKAVKYVAAFVVYQVECWLILCGEPARAL
jgi:hypothetical protein